MLEEMDPGTFVADKKKAKGKRALIQKARVPVPSLEDVVKRNEGFKAIL